MLITAYRIKTTFPQAVLSHFLAEQVLLVSNKLDILMSTCCAPSPVVLRHCNSRLNIIAARQTIRERVERSTAR